MSRRIGLRQRFILLIISLFIILFTVVATVLVVRASRTERTTLNEQSKSFATLATKPIGQAFLIYKDSGKLRIQQQVQTFTDLNPDVSGVSIVDTKGKMLFSTGAPAIITQKQAESFDTQYVTYLGTIGQIISPVIEDFGVHRYAVVYSFSDDRLQENIRRTVEIIVVLSIVAFTVAIFVTYQLMSSLFLSPVRTISAKALKISEGNLDEQIQLKRRDELGDLAAAVNTMASSLRGDIVKLQETDRLKTEFITISSHNLRTPLTVIKGNLELLGSMEMSEEVHHIFGALSVNTARLDNFTEDLLAISSMESGQFEVLELKPAELKPLLETITANYYETARQTGIKFDVQIDMQNQKVAFSTARLKLALVNVLENAFKFTREGMITFHTTIQNDQAVISISDTGIGIAKDELPKLFTKFHRGTSLLQYDYEGTGIGLYLTKLIINDHHGSIEVTSEEGKGATFTVHLPLLPPEPTTTVVV